MRLDELPILIVYPHNRCNCRCVMCDIWRQTATFELTANDVERWRPDLIGLRVGEIVLSGGEPLMHSDLGSLAEAFRSTGARLTLLTTGLLLEQDADLVAGLFDTVIVSLDGPRGVHDRIRRVDGAYDRLAAGIKALDGRRPIQARCTVQKANHRELRETVRAARALGLDSISFLAVDVTSDAFDHDPRKHGETQRRVGLEAAEIPALAEEVEGLIAEESERGFVRESPEKLRGIVRRFRARAGLEEPAAPPCTAPWVSAVIETDGSLRPCYFHQTTGNAREQGLLGAVNSDAAIRFRRGLDVTANAICRNCVCSLNRPVTAGSADRSSSSGG